MYIKSCPKCGRLPKIGDCISIKNKTRRRMCYSPCGHISLNGDILKKYNCIESNCYTYYFRPWYFVIEGNSDDNAIYKIWNEALIDG